MSETVSNTRREVSVVSLVGKNDVAGELRLSTDFAADDWRTPVVETCANTVSREQQESNG